jgi:hypothetical protein
VGCSVFKTGVMPDWRRRDENLSVSPALRGQVTLRESGENSILLRRRNIKKGGPSAMATDNDRKSVAEMLGEFLREAAVLTAVFLPMDRVVAQRANFTWEWLWVTLLISAVLLIIGIMVDKVRKD